MKTRKAFWNFYCCQKKSFSFCVSTSTRFFVWLRHYEWIWHSSYEFSSIDERTLGHNSSFVFQEVLHLSSFHTVLCRVSLFSSISYRHKCNIPFVSIVAEQLCNIDLNGLWIKTASGIGSPDTHNRNVQVQTFWMWKDEDTLYTNAFHNEWIRCDDDDDGFIEVAQTGTFRLTATSYIMQRWMLKESTLGFLFCYCLWWLHSYVTSLCDIEYCNFLQMTKENDAIVFLGKLFFLSTWIEWAL